MTPSGLGARLSYRRFDEYLKRAHNPQGKLEAVRGKGSSLLLTHLLSSPKNGCPIGPGPLRHNRRRTKHSDAFPGEARPRKAFSFHKRGGIT